MLTRMTCMVIGLWMGLASAVFAGPKLEIVEPIYKFGECERGKTVEHTFVLKNTGDEKLVIERVKHACGCTKSEVKKKEIPPGGTTELVVKLSLALQKGHQERNIAILTNDPANREAKVSLVGTATSRVKLEPEIMTMRTETTDKEVTAAINVKGIDGLKFNITRIDTSGTNIVATKSVTKAGEEYQINVTVKPPLEEGAFKGWLHLRTDQKGEYALIGIPISVTVVGDVVVRPQKIELSTGMKKPMRQVLVICPGKVREFKINSVEVPVPSISVATKQMGSVYQVILSNIEVSNQLDGKVVKLKTDIKGGKDILIPIRIRKPESHTATAHAANRDKAKQKKSPAFPEKQ